MTFSEGLFILFGILAYCTLWLFIFLQFIELVKQSADTESTPHKSGPNLLDVAVVSCSEIFNENLRELCEIIEATSPQKPHTVACPEPLL